MKISNDPLFKISNDPLFKILNDPLFKILNDPLFNISNHPLFKILNDPLFKILNDPLFNMLNDPLFNISNDPLFKILNDHLFKILNDPLFKIWKKISVSKFDGNKISVSDMDRKNILKALYALKILFLYKKKCCKHNSAVSQSENKYFDFEKKPIAQAPGTFWSFQMYFLVRHLIY